MKIFNKDTGEIEQFQETCNHSPSMECGCDCHKGGKAHNHIIPCCQFCSLCSRNIRLANWVAWKTNL